MMSVCLGEAVSRDQTISLKGFRKCFSDGAIISPLIWGKISSNMGVVDRVVALSIKPLGYGEERRATFHRAMIETIQYGSEIYSEGEGRSLKDVIKFITSDESASKVIDERVMPGPFRNCLKKCIAIFAYTSGEESVKSSHIDAYITFHGYLDHLLSDEEKREYSYRLQGISKEHLEILFAKIEAIEFSSYVKNQGQLKKFFLETVCLGRPIGDVIKLIDLVNEMMASAKMSLYFFNYEATANFFERLLGCIGEDQISIHMMTCPDYSGSLIDGVWQYDFCSLGSEEGFVAARAIGFVSEFARIAEKYISKVEIHHFLPTHEFIEADEKFGDYTSKLKSSLEKIRSLYPREVHTHLSSEWLSDDLFQIKKKELLRGGIDDAFALEVVRKRNALYDKFYPGMEPEALLNCVKSQIAEYLLVGEMLTASSHSVLLASDSTVMCKSYLLKKIPFLFGKVKGAAHYLGD